MAKICAIIAAKGDSRRLPGKNRKLFCGFPLLEWTLIQAKRSKYISTIVVVTSDDEAGREIDKIVQKYHFCATVFQPLDEIEKAEANGQIGGSVAFERGLAFAQQMFQPDVIVLMLPTQPMRKPEDIDNAIDMFMANKSLPVASVCNYKDLSLFEIKDGALNMVLFDKTGRYYHDNGMVSVMTPELWQKVFKLDEDTFRRHDVADENRKAQPYIAELWQIHDIDTQEDFEFCERIMEEKILKGQGEKVYDDYQYRVLSEYGFHQTAGQYNAAVEEILLPKEYRNSFYNHLPLFLQSVQAGEEIDHFELVEVHTDNTVQRIANWKARNAKDVSKAALATPEPVLIIGSGPSLDEALPIIKDWKGAIICSTSQASTLAYWGKDPTYIVAYDVNTGPEELRSVPSWAGRNSTLISHPGIDPRLMEEWPNKKLLFRSMDSSNHFMNKVLPVAYKEFIPSAMYLFSCSLSAQLSLAHAMNYSPVFFVGCDFANKRFTSQRYENGEWKETRGVHADEGSDNEFYYGVRFLVSNNGVKTDAMSIFYKRSLFCVWCIDHAQVINTSTKGIITEMPSANIEAVIAYQGKGFESLYFTNQQIDDAAETYLAHFNQFIVRFKGGGVRVVESGADGDKWRDNVKAYMDTLNNQSFNMEGGKYIDIDANIARFDYVKARAK